MATDPPRRQVAPTAQRRWRSLHMPAPLYAALVLAAFLGTIQLAQIAGFWSTSGKITLDGAPVEVTGADPAEVKGWMTISDVLGAYGLTQDELYTHYQIPADLPTSAALKDIEAIAPEFSVTDLRVWLAERAAQP
ncbi:hypothetical protein K2Z83_06475 [Oscillochloris sp. ZM17-4]|uniref:hypothetical protein n=1 Tax=Oscillochloris sp. ZM17-4 TaxID=2866714 RepID=UPI001C73C099|nr:hypothetical protein [Oscillochloris sp. ZM17-4]MBX0327320.1 hypothetical protein [Oscillochloris sp. ZM17-4]